jgi:hypothetical protein
MAKRFLSVSALTVVGATARPQDTNQVLVGAVIGFVSDNETQTFQCVGSLLEDGTDVSGAVGDLRKGLATRNVTEISQGVSAISDLLNNKEGTKENCAVDADHVGIVLKALKAYHNPKKLISHVVTEFVNDGDNIFGKMALADHDWLGGDHFNAGANLGMALRRSLVGEFNAQPVDMTEWQLLLAGLPVGFLSDDAHLVQCGFGMISGFGDLKTGAQGLEQGLKEKNMTKITDSLNELTDGWQKALNDKTTCKVDEAHFKSIMSAFEKNHSRQDIVSHLVGDGENIFTDLAQADTAYLSGDALGAGIHIGMAFRRVLVAEAAPTDVVV